MKTRDMADYTPEPGDMYTAGGICGRLHDSVNGAAEDLVERRFDDATGPWPFTAIITVWRPYTAQEARDMADQHVDDVLEGYAEDLVEWCGHEDDAASDVLDLIPDGAAERLRDVLREIAGAFVPGRYKEAFDIKPSPDWWGPYLRGESEARDNRERADREAAEWYAKLLSAERNNALPGDKEGGEQ